MRERRREGVEWRTIKPLAKSNRYKNELGKKLHYVDWPMNHTDPSASTSQMMGL